MKKALLLFACALLSTVALGAVSAFAQNGIVTVAGVSPVGTGGDTTTEPSATVIRVVFRLDNNIGHAVDISLGFRISTPDGAVWDSVQCDSAGPMSGSTNLFQSKFNSPSGRTGGFVGGFNKGGNGTNPDTVGFLMAANPPEPPFQMEAGYNDTALAIKIWQNGKGVNGTHICVDSSGFRPFNEWVWAYLDSLGIGVSFSPNYIGLPGQTYSAGGADLLGRGYCFLVGTPTGVDDATGNLPTHYSLAQNYPNPFNPATTIKFDLPVRSKVTLAVYNVLGQKVATLADGWMDAGKDVSVNWNASASASGIYFYKLEATSKAGSFVQTKKMVLVK